MCRQLPHNKLARKYTSENPSRSTGGNTAISADHLREVVEHAYSNRRN